MQKIITLTTDHGNGLYDITTEVTEIITASKVQTGIASVYARGSTAAIMIQENWDQSVQNDVVTLLNRLIPHGIWEHDRQDNNGDSHLKAGLGRSFRNNPCYRRQSRTFDMAEYFLL